MEGGGELRTKQTMMGGIQTQFQFLITVWRGKKTGIRREGKEGGGGS